MGNDIITIFEVINTIVYLKVLHISDLPDLPDFDQVALAVASG